jgi:hypothetical protein
VIGATGGSRAVGTLGVRPTATVPAGVTVGPGGLSATSPGFARGFRVAGGALAPYAGFASASRGVTVRRSGSSLGARSPAALRLQGTFIRSGFKGYSSFSPGWFGAQGAAWGVPAWTAGDYWGWSPFVSVARFCDLPLTGGYDYGSNLSLEDDEVYHDGEAIATAEQYATQATEIALAGKAARPSKKEVWKSLGVFAVVQGDEKEASNIFQFAISKAGVIRGNYYNCLTDTTVPIYGSVDKKTQRVAWLVGDKKAPVYETGLSNLSRPESTMLVHFGKADTQQWTLVRLEQRRDLK